MSANNARKLVFDSAFLTYTLGLTSIALICAFSRWNRIFILLI